MAWCFNVIIASFISALLDIFLQQSVEVFEKYHDVLFLGCSRDLIMNELQNEMDFNGIESVSYLFVTTSLQKLVETASLFLCCVLSSCHSYHNYFHDADHRISS